MFCANLQLTHKIWRRSKNPMSFSRLLRSDCWEMCGFTKHSFVVVGDEKDSKTSPCCENFIFDKDGNGNTFVTMAPDQSSKKHPGGIVDAPSYEKDGRMIVWDEPRMWWLQSTATVPVQVKSKLPKFFSSIRGETTIPPTYIGLRTARSV